MGGGGGGGGGGLCVYGGGVCGLLLLLVVVLVTMCVWVGVVVVWVGGYVAGTRRTSGSRSAADQRYSKAAPSFSGTRATNKTPAHVVVESGPDPSAASVYDCVPSLCCMLFPGMSPCAPTLFEASMPTGLDDISSNRAAMLLPSRTWQPHTRSFPCLLSQGGRLAATSYVALLDTLATSAHSRTLLTPHVSRASSL